MIESWAMISRKFRLYVPAAAIVSLSVLGMGSVASALTISTSANPADGWRAIAPAGNLEGQPITAVGLAWESGHVGWNSSITFDDSEAAGWHAPVTRDISIYGFASTNNIWADGPQRSGGTPAYLRRVFPVDFGIGSAHIGGTSDGANLIDDDVQIYLNGVLILDDRDGSANSIPFTDVTAFLHSGQNLLAVKAQDSMGFEEHFSLQLVIVPVPEPGTALLVTLGIVALAGRSVRRRATDVR